MRGQLGERGRGVERRVDRRLDQRVLVGEDAEDGALGDAGRLGDLPGGHLRAVLREQRQGGRDQGGPPLLGRQRAGPPSGAPDGGAGYGHSTQVNE